MVDDDDEIFENSMSIGNLPEFNPSTIINVNNQENLDDEEYRLFGTPSSSDSEGLVEEVNEVDDDGNHHGDNDDAAATDDDDDNANDDDDDEEMDDDVGTLSFPLVNSEGLNFF